MSHPPSMVQICPPDLELRRRVGSVDGIEQASHLLVFAKALHKPLVNSPASPSQAFRKPFVFLLEALRKPFSASEETRYHAEKPFR